MKFRTWTTRVEIICNSGIWWIHVSRKKNMKMLEAMDQNPHITFCIRISYDKYLLWIRRPIFKQDNVINKSSCGKTRDMLTYLSKLAAQHSHPWLQLSLLWCWVLFWVVVWLSSCCQLASLCLAWPLLNHLTGYRYALKSMCGNLLCADIAYKCCACATKGILPSSTVGYFRYCLAETKPHKHEGLFWVLY